MTKRIYLDMNHWIKLLEIEKGKEKNQELMKVYQKIIEVSKSGEVVFPVSFTHLQEALIRKDDSSRERLVELMVSISRGWVISSFNLFIKKEVENALLRRLGRPPLHDIKSQIVRKGSSYIFNEGYEIIPVEGGKPISKEEETRIREIVDSPKAMLMALKMPVLIEAFRSMRKIAMEVVEEMENNRLQKLQIKDEDRRYRESAANYMINVIVPHITTFLLGRSEVEKIIAMPAIKEDMEKFLEDMPSTNTAFRLINTRDNLENRPIRITDLGDVTHTATAVPYCDIVVTEGMMAHLCTQNKLDKKYGCTVLRSLKDLNKIL